MRYLVFSFCVLLFAHVGRGATRPEPIRIAKEVDMMATPVWSPDRTRLAYAWQKYSLTATWGNVAVVDIATGTESRPRGIDAIPGLGFEYVVHSPTWTPDGDDLFVVMRGGVWRVGCSQPMASQVPVSTEQQWSSHVVSPDGTRIALILDDGTRNGSGLFVASLDGTTPTRLAPGVIRAPCWSHDGQRIAYSKADDAGYGLWIIPAAGGTPVRVDADAIAVPSCAWSPGDQDLAFSSRRGGFPDLWVIRLATGEMWQVTSNTPYEFDPNWSPDGTQIAFIEYQGLDYALQIVRDPRTVDVRAATISSAKSRYR